VKKKENAVCKQRCEHVFPEGDERKRAIEQGLCDRYGKCYGICHGSGHKTHVAHVCGRHRKTKEKIGHQGKIKPNNASTPEDA
jgi:hypothetical protein